MTQNETIKFVALRTLGNFLVLFSIYGVIATFGPLVSAEAKYVLIQARGVHITVASTAQVSHKQTSEKPVPGSQLPVPKTLGFPELLSGSKEQILTPIDPMFSILIPKLGANVRVFPNVDPDNPQAYLPILQQGVAHAKGSVFPGQPGTSYLFAHSADNWWDVGRYNAVFYTLNNLSEGDEIDVFFENTRYRYTVSEKIISDPEDTTLLTSQHVGPSKLVLQTCWPPGTTLKRLYVVAKPAKTTSTQ